MSTMTHEDMARIIHETLRAYAATQVGDDMAAWADAPDWQHAASLDAVKFHLENPDAPASSTHDAWMAHKIADGWVFGARKDAKAKTHPCLVPFDDLPVTEKRKDYLVAALVRALST